MQFLPHPDRFKPLYLRLLTTWNAIGTALEPLEEAVEKLQGETPNGAAEGTFDEAYQAYESWEEAVRLVHWQVLQACHEHCVEPPMWLQRTFDCYEPDFPQLPFRCACGLSHSWPYYPDHLARHVDDGATCRTSKREAP